MRRQMTRRVGDAGRAVRGPAARQAGATPHRSVRLVDGGEDLAAG